MKRIISLILVLTVLFSLTACGKKKDAEGTLTERYEAVLTDAIKKSSDYICDKVKEPNYGSVGGEWTIIGLARSGADIPDEYFEMYFQNVSAYTASQSGVLHAKKYTEYSRVILAVTAAGYDPTDVGGYNLLLPLADFDQTVFQGINGPIFALLALDCGNYEIPENVGEGTQATRDMYVDYIINAQLPEGGWSLMGGEADVDLTAMALQALSKYSDRKDVAEAIEKGVEILSSRQNENGGYQYSGDEIESSESVTQVITALVELGIPLDDPRFVKNGNTLLDAILRFMNDDGGFSHLLGDEIDLLATEQAFCALAAINIMWYGEGSLYRMK